MDTNDKPMSVGGWLLTWLLLAIPIVGFVFSIIWLFGVGNRSRVTFIRSFFILALICIGLILTIFAIIYLTGAKLVNLSSYV